MHSAIFSGQVSHSRKGSLKHAFQYPLFMMYLDLGELSRVFDGRWLWSTKRTAVARFKRDNYLGSPSLPLDQCVRDLVEEQTGERPTGPIRLLTHLSYFGYCFNPISIYYCFDRDDETVETIVAEVSNTPWGERHCYVLASGMNRGDGKAKRYVTEKKLHVSPFMAMNMEYDWLLTDPSDELVLRINNRANGETLFNATLILNRDEISGSSLARVLIKYPFMTAKVLAGIHWQALKLWFKGCPVQDHPDKRQSTPVSQ